MVWAATEVDVPIAVSFTVETDGLLPDGGRLLDAVAAVDRATDGAAAYFGVNCAHPEHLRRALAGTSAAPARLRCFRANASRRSHAELDRATTGRLPPRHCALCEAHDAVRLPDAPILAGPMAHLPWGAQE